MDEITRATRETRKETESLDNLNGPVGIRKGKQVVNYAVDQNYLISYFNRIPVSQGGSAGEGKYGPTRNGICDPTLHSVILSFQTTQGLGADGVVDPGGPTLKRIKAVAAGVRKELAGKINPQEQRVIDDIYELIDMLKALLAKPTSVLDPHERAKLRTLLQEMEAKIGSSGAKPSPGRPRAQNAITIGIVLIIAIMALCVALIGMLFLDWWSKNSKFIQAEAAEWWRNRIEGTKRLLTRANDWVRDDVIPAMERVYNKARSIDRRKAERCSNSVFMMEANLTKLMTLMRRFNPTQTLYISTLVSQFMKALTDLLICLGVDGAPILALLREITAFGVSIADILWRASEGKFSVRGFHFA